MSIYEYSLISVIIIVVSFLYTIIYFLPTIIGFWKEKYNKNSILIINLLTGWSVIGWILSVILVASSKDGNLNKKNIYGINSESKEKDNEIKFLMNFIFSIYSFFICFVPIYGEIIAVISIIMSIKINEACKKNTKLIVSAGLIISTISAIMGTIISGIVCGMMLAD